MSKSKKTSVKKQTTKPKAPAKAETPKATITTKPAKEVKAKKVTLLDAAAQVLKSNGEPMNCKAMVAAVTEKKLWSTSAPTPEATLYSAILRELKKGKDARFKKVDRGQFVLTA